ncbi:Cadherin, partial [Oryctes borbonicus]
HGTPTRHAHTTLKLSVQSSSENPPRFVNSMYYANIAENAGIGTFVVKVAARSTHNEKGGNLTFSIPSGIADDAFTINPITGTVKTNKPLDREQVESYIIPTYVTDFSSQDNAVRSQFDIATIHITITDVNDHTPEFKVGACYPLAIPENNDFGIVHTVVATDLDSGKNGEVTYSVTGGNIGNKFSIDAKTGELAARSLDRESHSRYHLTITAQDRGNPSLQGSCNISVLVEDQNDNDPKFDSPSYSTSVLEDVAVDTSVLRVKAKDADLGVNARIIYSLANESQWLFRIDNKTGIITTAGLFDRERQNTYNFLVVATDSGKYNARSQKVPVKVQILDANDNKPIFTKYPFKEKISAYIQPGHTILKVSAKDADQGTNADIVYSLVSGQYSHMFRINPNTGMLSASQSLASQSGKIIHLNVIATDKGNPPQSSTGLIEIYVGDTSEDSPKLRFQNSSYKVTISENMDPFKDVMHVAAIRSDGRRQKIVYSFGTGNEEGIFQINSETGAIQVQNSRYLDYELHKEVRLVVEAKTESNPILYGYCEVIVSLMDQNDNAPKFSQQQYSVSVYEGNNKNALVLQVFAFDADEG